MKHIYLTNDDAAKSTLVEMGLINKRSLKVRIEDVLFQKIKKLEGKGFVINFDSGLGRAHQKSFGIYMSDNYWISEKTGHDCFPAISNKNLEKNPEKILTLYFTKNEKILVAPRKTISFYDADKVMSHGIYSTCNTIEEIIDYFGNTLKREIYQIGKLQNFPNIMRKLGMPFSMEYALKLNNVEATFERETIYDLHETFYLIGKISPEQVISREFLNSNNETEKKLIATNFSDISEGWKILK